MVSAGPTTGKRRDIYVNLPTFSGYSYRSDAISSRTHEVRNALTGCLLSLLQFYADLLRSSALLSYDSIIRYGIAHIAVGIWWVY